MTNFVRKLQGDPHSVAAPTPQQTLTSSVRIDLPKMNTYHNIVFEGLPPCCPAPLPTCQSLGEGGFPRSSTNGARA